MTPYSPIKSSVAAKIAATLGAASFFSLLGSPAEAIVCPSGGVPPGGSCGTVGVAFLDLNGGYSPDPSTETVQGSGIKSGVFDYYEFDVDPGSSATPSSSPFDRIFFEFSNMAPSGSNPGLTFAINDPMGNEIYSQILGADSMDVAQLEGVFLGGTYSLTLTGGNTLVPPPYDFTIIPLQTTVPTPLPILGAGVAFGFSRNLRRRVKKPASILNS